ncbi:G-type lectin S-receptor-like serine/threonine-protein kinase [Sesamum alatum]|uniref:Receptor-like serine/threonine-protein kinase n=1 Tax=Sesamum alatum TaxID=300844 RepID=A0AAE1Y1F1_9LAMI|nr:G-type lectin S-receptor-like serine/threonine-protein kinase [Sesamum alatum]
MEKNPIISDDPMIFKMVKRRSTKSMFRCFCFLLLMFMFFSGCLCIGSGTILAGQSLFSNQTIISKDGKFELGFFAPGNASNFYVGIWYKNIPARTVVWVANRNNPIPQSSHSNSRLAMSEGNLYLYANSVTIWAAETSNASEAVILDTGNFVLRNASGIIWQSFDYPTDTWLPGASVGFRGFSNTEMKLISWRNPEDPGIGAYSLGMELNGGSELFINRNGSERRWRSGVWEGGAFPSLSRGSNFLNFTYVSRDDAVYLTYNVYNEGLISRIVIDFLGQLRLLAWSEASQVWILYETQPSNACQQYALCGPNAICDIRNSPTCGCLVGFVPRVRQEWDLFDFSSGCVRTRPLQCASENADFIKVSSIRLPANPESLEIRRRNICRIVCSVNCTCHAYADNGAGGCLLFNGDLLDLERLSSNSSAGGDLYVRMDPVALPGKGNRSFVLPLALAVSITAGILVSCFCLCYLRRKLKSKASHGAHQNLLLLDLNSNGTAYNKHNSVRNGNGQENNNQYELPIFNFSSIVAATNDFSITNKLGEGGFGPVYKGELLNKQFVAVKRLSRRSGQGLEEFRNETELIAKLQHRNLVGILGCCIEKDEKILVYEYMPNKSLDFFLFDATKKEVLDWTRRVHIIEGIAQGLLYLHHYSRLRIVHRDLKASNILLDAEMNPKISDFGMARIFGGNDSQANTKRIVGTYGYMSPEYAMEGLFSVKSDVFAFGVLMLEIISGKKNAGFHGSDCLSLLGHAWNLWEHDRVLELVDPILDVSCSRPLRYIQIGLLCVQDRPADRPLISDVAAMLNNEQTALASPHHPAYTAGRTLANANPRESKVELCSINNMTVSLMEAR